MRYSDTQGVLNTAVTFTPTQNSPFSFFVGSSGLTQGKAITLSANNTTASVNVFQITGTVRIFSLTAVLTSKTTLTNCTAASFDLYDGAATVQLTKNDGVLSGVAVGTFIAKIAGNGTTFGKNDNVAGALMENPDIALSPVPSALFKEFVVTQKTGANTYIRFTYSTTDAPANAVLTVYANYIPGNQPSDNLVAV